MYTDGVAETAIAKFLISMIPQDSNVFNDLLGF